MRPVRATSLLAAALIVVTACGSADETASTTSGASAASSTTTATTATTTTTTTTTTTSTAPTVPATTEPASTPPESPEATVQPPDSSASDDVDAAIDDLRSRVGDPDAQVEIVSQEAVTWPNGALGCPQPGMSYTQALVDGTRLVLRHDGSLYEYHSGGSRGLFFCPAELVRPPTSDPGLAGTDS